MTGPEVIGRCWRVASRYVSDSRRAHDCATDIIAEFMAATRDPSEVMIENDEISRITIDKAMAIHSSELPCAAIWRAMHAALAREMGIPG